VAHGSVVHGVRWVKEGQLLHGRDGHAPFFNFVNSVNSVSKTKTGGVVSESCFLLGKRGVSKLMDAPEKSPPPLQEWPNASQWITILHLSALAGIFLVGFGHVLGPFIIWLLKKQDVPGMDAAGRNVLNFQVSWTLWALLAGVVAFLGSCLVFPLVIPLVVFLVWLYQVIRGAIAASNGNEVVFPATIRFFS